MKRIMMAGVVAMWAGSGWAGALDAPAVPSDAASGMYTLEDIYQRLTSNKTTNVTSFAEPSAGPTSGTMHTLNDIYAVAIPAQVPKTGAKTSSYTTDDGALKRGVPLPMPRFSPVAETGVETNQIRDNLTGLIWARDANLSSNLGWSASGVCTWTNAFNVVTNVNGINYGGTNDWRLPNVLELISLYNWANAAGGSPYVVDTTGTNAWSEARGPFTSVITANPYWTSTTTYPSPTSARCITFGQTVPVGTTLKVNAWNQVWPVRGGRQ